MLKNIIIGILASTIMMSLSFVAGMKWQVHTQEASIKSFLGFSDKNDKDMPKQQSFFDIK